MINKIRKSQEEYYSDLYKKHKGTPLAVSSESLAHKNLRYSQLIRLFESNASLTVHDVGMGIGHFHHYLTKHLDNLEFDYSGTEVVKDFYDYCVSELPDSKFYLRDLAEKPGDDKYDYVVMSGVFHQIRSNTRYTWENFMESLLINTFSMCNKGIGFNLVSGFVDYYQEGVYYANLPKLVNFINDKLSRYFAINHAYPLFEMTVFVYKESYMRSKHKQVEFRKYFKQ
jgi:hypothetical protein